jgi:F-type H+-transporting ATPase subunit delta
MKVSKQARREAKELFRDSFVNGALDENRVRQFVNEVVELKPRGYAMILSHYHRLIKLEIESRMAKVESPAPLSPELQLEVTNKLNGIYGRGLNISFAQNPALLGGLRIKVGSDVYDGSVEARLESLEESF